MIYFFLPLITQIFTKKTISVLIRVIRVIRGFETKKTTAVNRGYILNLVFILPHHLKPKDIQMVH